MLTTIIPAANGHRVVSKHIVRLQLYSLLLALDWLSITASFGCGWLLRFRNLDSSIWLHVVGVLLPIFTAVAVSSGAYSIASLNSPTRGAFRAVRAFLAAIAGLLFVCYFLKVDVRISRFAVALAIVVAVIAVTMTRKIAGELIRQWVRGMFVSEVLIRDGSPVAAPAGMTILDAAQEQIEPDPMNPLVVQRLAELLWGADRVVVSCPKARSRAWAMLLKGANVDGEILASEFDELGMIGVSALNGRTTLVVAAGPLTIPQRAMKRAFDLALAVPALVILAPIFVIICALIRLDSRGPIFFRQPRVGRGNVLFDVLKFRSMSVLSSDRLGTRSTQVRDERITRVGRFIRATSIDELPQLLNVLLGDMSIVGPRPHALGSLAGDKLFWEVDERYWHRHALKPGITGLAQVRGFRGATHERGDLKRRLQADLEYLSGWSIWRDIFIIVSTLRVIVHPKAY